MLKTIKSYLFFFPELIIFSFAFLTRFVRLDFPKGHAFDEVYHVFTAQRIFQNDLKAWEWWNSAPLGFAYEWTHPPLAKEFMAFAIWIFGDSSFSWRFFSALFGFGTIILIYLISKNLFKSRLIALFACFVASLDGLLLVMSRIGMNDSYFVFFSLLALFLLLKNKEVLMGISLGLAISSKWTAAFAIFSIGVFFLYKNRKDAYKLIKTFALFLLAPAIIYIISYLPFFLGKHSPPNQNLSNIETFVELQKQMWFYHTNLNAKHGYQSVPSEWVFNLRPVWMYSDARNNLVSNIYSLGNPVFAWGGVIAVIFLTLEFLKKRKFNLFIILFSYFCFFIPWFFSPRIMFNYHYLLSSTFLAIALGVFLNKLLNKYAALAIVYLVVISSLFFYFYPLWTGVYIEKPLHDSYFWFKSWR